MIFPACEYLVSEDAFIKKVLPQLSKKNLLSGNEDAIAWKTPFNEDRSLLVINTDSIAWSSDALPENIMTMYHFGMKLVTVTVSDIITKGAKPYYFLSTITIPKEFSESKLSELFSGLLAGCQLYNLEYMGGDLGSSKELVLSGVVIGYAKEEYLLKRSSMNNNDLVCSTGLFGYTGLGYSYYLDKSKDKISDPLLELINKKLTQPEAQLEWLPYLRKYATATIDSSDGLGKSLQHLANESNKQIIIENLPAFQELEQIVPKDSNAYNKAVLFAGEEFEIIFSISEEKYSLLLSELNTTTLRKPIVIGKVTIGQGVIYKGVQLLNLKQWDSMKGQFDN